MLSKPRLKAPAMKLAACPRNRTPELGLGSIAEVERIHKDIARFKLLLVVRPSGEP